MEAEVFTPTSAMVATGGVAVVVASMLSTSQPSLASTPSSPSRTDGVPVASRLFVIVGENSSLGELTRKNVPYTWDEQGDAAPRDPRVGNIWFGHQVKPGIYSGSWTHASLLRTVEDEFRLTHLAGARVARAIRSNWR
jgi:hypothetical protein